MPKPSSGTGGEAEAARVSEVYLALKASAASHRRSLNSEVIVCLEAVLLPGRATAEQVITRARALRELLAQGQVSAQDIDTFKRADRP